MELHTARETCLFQFVRWISLFFVKQINQNLITQEQISLLLPTKWELTPIYRMEHLKIKRSPVKQHASRLNSMNSTNKNNEEQSKHSEIRDIINELEEIYRSILPSNSISSAMSNSHFMKASSEDFPVTVKRQRLLLNLAHISLKFDEVNICSQILGYLKETELVVSIQFWNKTRLLYFFWWSK